MKHLSIFLLFNFIYNFCSAQTIRGTIINQDKHPVPKATLHILNTDIYSSSDNSGNFEIHQPGKNIELEITSAGYAPVLMKLDTVPGNGLKIILPYIHKELGQVVVSAEKSEGEISEKPLSVTVIDREKINAQQIWDQNELSAMAPNLYLANSGDDRNVASIRGIGTTSYDPAVATYIDGVNQFSLDAYIAPLWNVERIEVLSGPQGTLYGRNALAGVISITTRQPANAWQSNITLTGGNYHRFHLQAATQGAIIKNRIFAGAAFLGHLSDGFYSNDFNNKNFDEVKRFGGNYFIKYLSKKQLSITLNFKHLFTKNNGAFPLVQGAAQALESPFHLSQNAVAAMHDITQNLSLVINKTLGRINLISQSAYQQNYRYYDAPLDGDFSPADMVTIINNYGKRWNNVKVFTQELRATGKSKNKKTEWTAGGFFFYQDNPVKQMTHFGEDAALIGAPDINFGTLASTKNYGHGIAFFGQFNYNITKLISAFAGVRYDNEHKFARVKGEYFKDGNSDPLFETRSDTSASASFEAWSPKLGITISPNTHHNGYLTYSRGFRSGGLTGLSSDPSTPPLYAYKPEYSNNVEMGWKYHANRINIHAAVYYTFLQDAQVPTLILPDAITVTRNTGKLEAKGFELELKTIPVKNLQLNGSLGYAHSQFKTLKYSSNGQNINLAGKRQVFSPDWTGFLGALYSIPLAKQVEMNLGLQLKYTGRQYFDFTNTISQSDYSLLNAQVAFSYKNIGIRFWAKNIAQKRYIAYAYDFGAVHLGDPRTYGLSLSARF